MKKALGVVLCLELVLSAALTGCALSDSEDAFGENYVIMENIFGKASSDSSVKPDAFVVSSAVYPQTAPYPDESAYVKWNGEIDDSFFEEMYDPWWEEARERRNLAQGCGDGLDGFLARSIEQFLSGSQGQNKVYSPVNAYMALGMLAEVTDGESRNQILALLGADNIEALRTQANRIWRANYQNDGAVISILANSLWLDERVHFKQATLDSLAENYYASSYRGIMGSEELNRALQAWLNEQTDGLLSEQASHVEMDDLTILALAATVNFHAKWNNEFREDKTEAGVFHSAGGDISCDFMHQGTSRTYYWGEKFSAVSQYLESDGAMWFILPDESVSVDDLLRDEQMMEFLLSDKHEWENNKYLIVNLAVPKFDVVSDMDLISGLKALGVTDIFDFEVSDFSPMTEDFEEVYLSQAKHAARVMIDEEGCTAVAYTVMAASGAGMPPDEEIDFTLDRPFLFVITGADELPLFVGIVNHP